MFKYDGPLIRFLEKVADLLILNFLALMFSIPIFTIGAVKSSLLYGIDKILKDEEGSVVATFFAQIKLEFKRTTAIWLMYVFLGGVALSDVFIMFNANMGNLRMPLVVVFLAFFLIFSCVAFCSLGWCFKFNDSIKATIKNGFFISILNLPLSLLMVILELIPFIVFFFVDRLIGVVLPIYILCGISLISLCEVFILRKMFKPYLPPKSDDSTDSSEPFNSPRD